MADSKEGAAPATSASGGTFELLFVYGLPAAGKLTVARELVRQANLFDDAAAAGAASGGSGGGSDPAFKVHLFHNHLVVDALLALFEFGSEPFIRLREQWWLQAFAEARAAALERPRGCHSVVVFTFCFEDTVDERFVHNVASIVTGAGDGRGSMRFLRLTCDKEVALSRLGGASRRMPDTSKATDEPLMRSLIDAGVIFVPEPSSPHLPEGAEVVTFATTEQAPAEVARLALGELWPSRSNGEDRTGGAPPATS